MDGIHACIRETLYQRDPSLFLPWEGTEEVCSRPPTNGVSPEPDHTWRPMREINSHRYQPLSRCTLLWQSELTNMGMKHPVFTAF